MKVVYNMFGFYDYPIKETQNKFRVGSGYVVYDYKSDTDLRVAGRIFSRKSNYRLIHHNTPFLTKQCGHCGFPLVTYTDTPHALEYLMSVPYAGRRQKAMRVHNDGRGYRDQQQNGLIRYIVGDGYIEYDPKSETDVRLSYAIWQRAQHFRIVDNGDGVLLETPCSTCGFPMNTVEFLFGGIVVYERFDACPLCGEPVPAGLASEEVKQECE